MPSPLVLIVDDEALVRELIAHAVQSAGYDVAEVGDGESALKAIDELKPDLVLLDIVLPGMSGIEVVKRLDADHPPIIVLSSYVERLKKTVQDGRVYSVLGKPATIQRIVEEVEAAFQERGNGNALMDTKDEVAEQRERDLERVRRHQDAETQQGGG